MASSSSTTFRWQYDVFLSFRGKDTRDNFTSHLYDALCRNKIKTFIDNELERGEQITKALLETIERSRISVIIFSKNYASSSWCVDELVKILECQKTHKQIVLPVFYHVDPSDVDELRGGFGDAFAELETNFKGRMDKVPSWRDALNEAVNISGWDSQVIKPEAKLVNEIVVCIRNKLVRASSRDSKGLVGVMSRISDIKNLLCKPELCILGLWGMAGMGKTTLAGEIFNELSHEYEASCFLTSIGEISEESRGLHRLREELLSSLLGETIQGFSMPRIGSTSIKARLCCKKVLVVLDDVSDAAQVEFLIQSQDFFGAGSRILVTSQDKHVLQTVVDQVYEIEGLDNDEALQLFCLHSFKGNRPTEDFVEPSNQVVNYAQGNPLALKVLGSFLHHRRKQEWESELNKLERFPHPDIQKVLKRSYDALDDDVQNIFLDIACCFKGEPVHSVIRILDGCGFSTEIGVGVLADKCLITICDQKLGVHDLLQEMAYGIVVHRQKLGNYSRLWKAKDVYELLTKKLGTEKVEAIFLDSSRIRAVELSSGAFERMHNLRLLKIFNSGGDNYCKVLFPHGLEYLSDELRYLHWDKYPLPSLPSSFHATNLVELNLSFSKVRQLWEGRQDLSNLKGLNLSHCESLTALPDLSLAKGLERLNLECCTNLAEIPSSILFLDSLFDLDLRDCKNLRCLPDGISSLTTLKLSGCSNLTECPVVSGSIEYLNLNETAIEALTLSVRDLGRLTALNLKECKMLANLPDNIFLLNSLVLLDISGCSNIRRFPNVEQKQNIRYLYMRETAIEELPYSICRLHVLVALDLTNCKMLQNLPDSIGELQLLQKLVLSGCSRITKFPEVSWGLKELYLDETAIEEVPSSIENSPDLVELHLRNCTRFTVMTTSIGKMKSLQRLNLSGCSRFENFPDISEPMKSLRYLYLDGTGIKNLPSPMENLQWLSCLELGNCKNLVNLTKGRVAIEYSVNLPGSDLGQTYLRKLDLSGCGIEELPLCISSMSSLEVLDLSGNEFESLPITINELSELLYLSVKNCKKLQSLPDLPPCLTTLDADNCTSLHVVSSSSNWTEGNIFDFSFINCWELDVDARNTIMGLGLKKFQLYTRRLYSQVPSVPAGVSSFCFPGRKIPEWFVPGAWGNSITIQLPSHRSARQLMGYSLCAVVAFRRFNGDSASGFQIKCRYQFKDGKGVDCNFGGRYGRKSRELFDSVHLFFGFDPCLDVRADFCSGKYREVSVQFSPEDMNDNPLHFAIVAMCGVRPVYAAGEDRLMVHVPVPPAGSSQSGVIDKDPVGPRGFKEFFLSVEQPFWWLFNAIPSGRFVCEEITQMMSKMKLPCKCCEEDEIGQSGSNVNSFMETDSNASDDEAETAQSGSDVNNDMETDLNGSDDKAETKKSGSNGSDNEGINRMDVLQDFQIDRIRQSVSDDMIFHLWEWRLNCLRDLIEEPRGKGRGGAGRAAWEAETEQSGSNGSDNEGINLMDDLQDFQIDRIRQSVSDDMIFHLWEWRLNRLRDSIVEPRGKGRGGAGRAAWEAETGQSGSCANRDMERKIIHECRKMCLAESFAFAGGAKWAKWAELLRPSNPVGGRLVEYLSEQLCPFGTGGGPSEEYSSAFPALCRWSRANTGEEREEFGHLVELINAFCEFWLGSRSCCGHQLEILAEARRMLGRLHPRTISRLPRLWGCVLRMFNLGCSENGGGQASCEGREPGDEQGHEKGQEKEAKRRKNRDDDDDAESRERQRRRRRKEVSL